LESAPPSILPFRVFRVFRGHMSSGPVAVIDIGSNSIKVLVAARGGAEDVIPLRIRTIDARISAGISKTLPRLGEEAIVRGVEAIRALLEEADAFQPTRTILVATSAVRDAENGAEFRERVKAATGHEVRILSGDEEANLIGRGLTADRALHGLRDFYVFDLGGGSLECLAFRERKIDQAVSVQLGCVRLTEKFVADPALPFSTSSAGAVAAHTRAVLAQAGFRFSLPPGTAAVGTGGTVTTVRSILGAREGKAFDATEPVVAVAQLRELLAWIGALPLPARKQINGLPASRADVFPAALATLITVAEVGGFPSYRNSLYNLRYGLADEALAGATVS
jgi:exopolyphosphatase/guanosine-5'-triphosphate,3'-diphosphate pyrophosphatase